MWVEKGTSTGRNEVLKAHRYIVVDGGPLLVIYVVGIYYYMIKAFVFLPE